MDLGAEEPQDYKIWAPDGCDLAETLERTSDRALWHAWFVEADASIKEGLARRLHEDLWNKICSSRLVPYRRDESTGESRRAMAKPWDQSSRIADLRSLPTLSSDSRAEVLANRPLGHAFKPFVLADPELEVLPKSAMTVAPD